MDTKQPEPRQPTKREAALRPYRRAGLTLIPLHRPDAERTMPDGKVRKLGKAPTHRDWPRRSYDTKAVIAAALATGRNVGVRIGGKWLVIDADPRNGGDDSFLNLCLDLGLDDAEWPSVITGSGGRHYYLRKAADERTAYKLPKYPGLEFKSGRGHQVVTAGSVHPDTGRLYHWDRTRPDLPDAPTIPDALLEALRRPDRAASEVSGGEYDADAIATMLAGLDPTAFRDHDNWLRIMMACHHASGGEARESFIAWSVADPEYADAAEMIGARWDSLHQERSDGITAATLFKALREAGRGDLIPANDPSGDFDTLIDEWLDGGAIDDKTPCGADSVTALVPVEKSGIVVNNRNVATNDFKNALRTAYRSGLNPRLNELSGAVEFHGAQLPWAESYGRVLSDDTLALARHFLIEKHQGIDYQPDKDNIRDALQTLAYESKYNPVLVYLDSLTWDGVSRVEHLFVDYFQCPDDKYTRAVARCFMIGAVRRQRRPGCKFDTLPVLRGPQGFGKSTGLEALFGTVFFSDADLGNLRDKDSAMKLRGIWLQELAEIDSLTRPEMGTLKGFLSRKTDRLREPWGRVVSDTPRRCVFAATLNEGGYLRDGTGGRRFWPLEIQGRVDVAAITRDRDQLWSEAATLESRGESLVLPESLWGEAARRQEAETSEDPWSDVLRGFLEQRERFAALPREGDDYPALPAYRVHSEELFDALGIPVAAATRMKAQQLRTVMEAMGWKHRRAVRIGDAIRHGYFKP